MARGSGPAVLRAALAAAARCWPDAVDGWSPEEGGRRGEAGGRMGQGGLVEGGVAR